MSIIFKIYNVNLKTKVNFRKSRRKSPIFKCNVTQKTLRKMQKNSKKVTNSSILIMKVTPVNEKSMQCIEVPLKETLFQRKLGTLHRVPVESKTLSTGTQCTSSSSPPFQQVHHVLVESPPLQYKLDAVHRVLPPFNENSMHSIVEIMRTRLKASYSRHKKLTNTKRNILGIFEESKNIVRKTYLAIFFPLFMLLTLVST